MKQHLYNVNCHSCYCIEISTLLDNGTGYDYADDDTYDNPRPEADDRTQRIQNNQQVIVEAVQNPYYESELNLATEFHDSNNKAGNLETLDINQFHTIKVIENPYYE